MKKLITLLSLLFTLATVTTQANEALDVDNFTYVSETDILTGENTSFIYTVELESEGYREGSLILTCNNGLKVTLFADTFLGSKQRSVRYRFGTEPYTNPHEWSINYTGRVAQPPASKQAAFIERALNAEHVEIQITTENNDVYTFILRLSDLETSTEHLNCPQG